MSPHSVLRLIKAIRILYFKATLPTFSDNTGTNTHMIVNVPIKESKYFDDEKYFFKLPRVIGCEMFLCVNWKHLEFRCWKFEQNFCTIY